MTELDKKLAKALNLKQGKEYKELGLNKNSPALLDYYLEVEEWDDDYDKVVGYTYINFREQIEGIKSLIKEVCEEVIGADEDLGIRISDRVPAEISSPIIERNKFRAKIRIKLNEIIR